MTQLQKLSGLVFLLLSPGFSQIVTDKDDWNIAQAARQRCSVVNQRSVINIYSEGAIIKVPSNTTRIDKAGLILCLI